MAMHVASYKDICSRRRQNQETPAHILYIGRPKLNEYLDAR